MRFNEFIKVLKKYIGNNPDESIRYNNREFLSYLFSLVSVSDECTIFDTVKDSTIEAYYKGSRPISVENASTIMSSYDSFSLQDRLSDIPEESRKKLIDDLMEYGLYLTENNYEKKICDLLLHYINAFANGNKNVDLVTNKKGIIRDCNGKTRKITKTRKKNKKDLKASDFLEPLFNDPDTTILASSIKRHMVLFVYTNSFQSALNKIRTNRRLMIVGAPGVGKSTISEMIVLDYLKQGYKVKYSSSLDEVPQILNNIINDNSEEIIYIDDCLGQAYFELNATQETTLKKLISYIKNQPNKVLLLNSRITIINSIKEDSVLSNEFKELKDNNLIFQLYELTDTEKAKILYNHLYYASEITNAHYSEIKNKKRYMTIISHPNYNPRIIEYITNGLFLRDIPDGKYFQSVKERLDNPQKIWDDEYNNKLKKEDRYLLIALYSLSNTNVSYELCRKAYERILLEDGTIDTTKNNWNLSLKVLNESLVRIIKVNDEKEISMINPSVNDYLRQNIMTKDSNALKIAKRSLVSYSQVERLFTEPDDISEVINLYKNGVILKLDFGGKRIQTFKIAEDIIYSHYLDKRYSKHIQDYAYLKYVRYDDVRQAIVFGGYSFELYYRFISNKELFDYYIGDKLDVDALRNICHTDNYGIKELCDLASLISKTDYICDKSTFLDEHVLSWLVSHALSSSSEYSNEIYETISQYYGEESDEDINCRCTDEAYCICSDIINEYRDKIDPDIYNELEKCLDEFVFDFSEEIEDYKQNLLAEEKADLYKELYYNDTSNIDAIFSKDTIK